MLAHMLTTSRVMLVHTRDHLELTKMVLYHARGDFALPDYFRLPSVLALPVHGSLATACSLETGKLGEGSLSRRPASYRSAQAS